MKMYANMIKVMITIYLISIQFPGNDARFAYWNAWSACSVECGKGWSTRERIVKRHECYTELSERRECYGKCERGENLALNKSVTSSSVFLSSFPSSNAVDGNKNTDFYNGHSCMMTNKDTNPFLRIDLGEVYLIKEVVIFNRGDCCSERLNNFVITVDSDVCGKGKDMTNTNVTVIPCSNPLVGQHVQLQIPGPQFLSVCEVEVYGSEVNLTNIALGKKVSQSTTASSTYVASQAVDGKYDTYTGTDTRSPHWWQIDLGSIVKIYKIRVFAYNSVGDYLRGSKLSIGSDVSSISVLGVFKGQITKHGSYYAYEFVFKSAIMGRVLKVHDPSQTQLLIREFEVYSYHL